MEDYQFYFFVSIVVGLFTYLHYSQQKRLDELAHSQHELAHSQHELAHNQHELAHNQQTQSLTSHQILSQLPASVVHIVLTPSAASATKDKNLKALLGHLCMNFPVPSESLHSSEVHFSRFNFRWRWPVGCTNEVSVYEPFCTAFRQFVNASSHVNLVSATVGNGQRLADGLLYCSRIFSLRTYSPFHKKKGKVLYRGEIRGRTDIVIMNEDPPGEIARHNVVFAVEIKKDLINPGNLQSGLREACTELLGLCGDNSISSPPVLLTDFVTVFIVVYLHKFTDIQLKFAIKADRCTNIKAALSLAYTISKRDCISADFGRPDTPTSSEDDI
jgi:hypothetical protein